MKTCLFQLTVAVFLLLAINATAAVLYVDVNSASPTPPYADWSTAAATIQDAVDAANPGDQILVTNGIYQTGGRIVSGSTTNRVTVNKAVTVQSVNGPAVTMIQGYQVPGITNGAGAVRCVYLASGAMLAGFTLTNGATYTDSGGGVSCQSVSATVSNCVLIGNSAKLYGGGGSAGTYNSCNIIHNFAAGGGGVSGDNVNNCVIISNSASGSGGGALFCSLTNCTVVGNSAAYGGGFYTSANQPNAKAVNCIVCFNTAPNGSNYFYLYANTMSYCCTTPLPSSGMGNITNTPGFVDLAGGNLRLQIGSPCINAGDNASAPAGPDLAGNPRIVGGTVDIGAYENQNTNPVHYVSLTSTNPVAPYTNWVTAAISIQDAVAVAQTGEFVVADAGVYTNSGVVIYGAETNRVALTNGITLLGVYGTRSTIIAGGTQTRCVYVGSNSVVSGFTITNGQTRLNGGDMIREESGGGIWCEPGGAVVNCLVISNFAGNGNNFQSGRLGGGIYGGTISNCVLAGNFSGSGGGTASNLLWNCILTNNTANLGGGAYGAVLYNCGLSNNAAIYNGTSGTGGGVYQCTLYNSILMNNHASGSGYGGGAYQGTNFNCLITGNAAGYGGGTYQSTNFSCIISGNIASIYGGGAYNGMFYNCVLSGNTVTNTSFYGNGGGIYASTYNSAVIINCTVTSNSATGAGGGIYGGIAFNSIIYFNSASGSANWTNNPYMDYCCTTPNPFYGTGNITNDPSFVDAVGGDFRLKCGSPCIDAGFTNCFSPVGIISAPINDIRGVARPLDGNGDGIAQFDMGAYEYDPAFDQIPVIRSLFAFANFAANYPVSFAGEIGGCADYFWWDFGDGVTVTNQSPVSHAWASPGTYNVLLTAYYSSLGYGLSATTQVQVVQQPVYYADLNSSSPTFPYTNWTTAAHTIQQAIAAGTTTGRLVLVTNGVYQTWGVIVYGSMYNNLALTNPVVVQSVNGPGATTIQPFQGRCAYVGNHAILSGFTLAGGRTLSSGDSFKEQSGGAVWCEPCGTVSNCVIMNNQAYYGGGGAYQGIFYNCTFTNNTVWGNSSDGGGGGATYQSVLYDSCVASNKVYEVRAGGCYGGMLSNCVVMNNTSLDGGDAGGACLSTLYNCTVSGNYGYNGGGGVSNTFWNCVLTGNYAHNGGGAYASTLHNCLVTSNQASSTGGGLYRGTLYNCTVVKNTAVNGGGFYGGGVYSAYNSIIYGNTASGSGNNWQSPVFGYNCCSIPQMIPNNSSYGNITNDPIFVDAAFHLSAASPCRGAGSSLYATGTDMDGEAWNNPPSMGADEVYDADFAGALSVAIQSSQTNVLVNHSLALAGLITGRAAGLEWSFGDGIIVTNVSYFTSHLWTNAGDYNVIFTAYNTDNPGGVSTNLLVHVLPLALPWLQPASFSMSSTNGFQFQFNGQADAIYTVQMATNLDPPIVWQNLQTIASTGGVVQVMDANATNVTSFYRVGVQ